MIETALGRVYSIASSIAFLIVIYGFICITEFEHFTILSNLTRFGA